MAKLDTSEYAPFENLKHTDENGNEYWFARELATALEYDKWEKNHPLQIVALFDAPQHDELRLFE